MAGLTMGIEPAHCFIFPKKLSCFFDKIRIKNHGLKPEIIIL